MKYILTCLTIFVISKSSYAKPVDPCNSRPVVILGSETEHFITSNQDVLRQLDGANLRHWGATTSQIKQAPCRNGPPKESDISGYLESLRAKGNKKSAKIRGVLFEDESPQLIEVFKKLTTKYDFFDKEEKDQINIQEKHVINPKCRKVICAAKKIFGEKLGPKLLYMNQKYGLNGSNLSFVNASKLKESEVDRLIVAVQDFPQSTFPMNKNKRFTKFKRGYTLARNGPGVVANAMIAFFDNWLSLESNEMMEYTALHELAHYTASELDLDDNPSWLAFSGWTEKDGKWSASKKNTFVSGYAKTSPAEDFAESVATYRYNPNLLKTVNPDKYTFIKETVFHGVEYTSENKCHSSNSYENILKKQVASKLKSFDTTTFLEKKENLIKLMKPCKNESLEFILNNSDVTLQSLDGCISNSIQTNLTSGMLNRISPPLKHSTFVQKKLTKFPQQTDNPQVRGASEIHLEARKLLKDMVINGFYEWDQGFSFKYPSSDARSLCEAISKSGYQSLGGINELFSDSLLTYHSSKKINKLMYKTCIKVQGSSPDPMSIEKIRVALPITIYTQKEIERIKVSLRYWKAQKKILVDALANNGIIFKAMNYLEYRERVQEIDNMIEKVELQIRSVEKN